MTETKLQMHECPLCGETYSGYGHNAWPLINDGKCCGECNMTQVVPARLAGLFGVGERIVKEAVASAKAQTIKVEPVGKVTFSKSEPFKSGWQGWADYIDVMVDGKQIGQLYAKGCDHRKHMEYTFTDAFGQMENSARSGVDIHVNEFGLRAAKVKLIEELRKSGLSSRLNK